VRTYKMRVLKKGDDKFRLWFLGPSAVAGQEMLRVGDNAWIYMPNLKRSVRIANRESFQGGDFNNADVMRVNYRADYKGVFNPSSTPEMHILDLTAQTQNAPYDKIKLWIIAKDFIPHKGEYYGSSGKLIRSAEFLDATEFEKGYKRPARVLMRNEIVKERYTELTIKSMKRGVQIPLQKFLQTDLGR
jgi:outer membrane lipoprotein-sorting protein